MTVSAPIILPKVEVSPRTLFLFLGNVGAPLLN